MRILVVATEVLLPGRHGGSTHVHEVTRHLRAHGEVAVLARRGSHGEAVVPVGLPLRRFPSALRSLDAARVLRPAVAQARKFGPDVIYERATSYGLGAMLSVVTGAPLVTMVLDQRYSWMSLLRARRVATTCAGLIPAAVRGKAALVGWGANPQLFSAELSKAEARARLGLAHRFVVGYSGSFQAWHGLDGLVRAARRMGRDDVAFLLIGDGPQRAHVERLAENCGIRDHFVFCGPLNYADVPASLAAADVCVAPFEPARHGPSRRRGFTLDPLKLFEYLALGKPTVTIRAANIEALFEHDTHLLLVEPGRDDQLADGIARLLDHPALAQRIAIAGRERVLSKHTWAAHAKQLVEIFGELVDAPPPG